MSGHALGKKQSHYRLTGLVASFVLGVFCITMLLILASVYGVKLMLYYGVSEFLIWAASFAEMIVTGVAVWLFYFRPGSGTALWVPRAMADFLARRSKKTSSNAEAFALGMASVAGELVFLVGPLTVTAISVALMPTSIQIAGIGLYFLVAVLPLVIIFTAIKNRFKIIKIQKWREENKKFIQFIAGSAMVILGFYIYATEIFKIGGLNV